MDSCDDMKKSYSDIKLLLLRISASQSDIDSHIASLVHTLKNIDPRYEGIIPSDEVALMSKKVKEIKQQKYRNDPKYTKEIKFILRWICRYRWYCILRFDFRTFQNTLR